MTDILKIADEFDGVNGEVITDLEMLLAAAKKGKFSGVAYVTIGLDGYEAGTGFAGTVKEDIYGSVGALELLKQRLLSRIGSL